MGRSAHTVSDFSPQRYSRLVLGLSMLGGRGWLEGKEGEAQRTEQAVLRLRGGKGFQSGGISRELQKCGRLGRKRDNDTSDKESNFLTGLSYDMWVVGRNWGLAAVFGPTSQLSAERLHV